MITGPRGLQRAGAHGTARDRPPRRAPPRPGCGGWPRARRRGGSSAPPLELSGSQAEERAAGGVTGTGLPVPVSGRERCGGSGVRRGAFSACAVACAVTCRDRAVVALCWSCFKFASADC